MLLDDVQRLSRADADGGAHAAREVRARADDIDGTAPSLSPGERTRAALALLAARGVNCLSSTSRRTTSTSRRSRSSRRRSRPTRAAWSSSSHDRRFLERLGGDSYDRAVTIDDDPCRRIGPRSRGSTRKASTSAPSRSTSRRGTQWDAGHSRPRLVARDDGEVLGWAALGPVSRARRATAASWRTRSTSRAPRAAAASDARCWSGSAGAADEADLDDPGGDLRRQRRVERAARECGFRLVGVRERLAQKRGRWRDVVYGTRSLGDRARRVAPRARPSGGRRAPPRACAARRSGSCRIRRRGRRSRGGRGSSPAGRARSRRAPRPRRRACCRRRTGVVISSSSGFSSWYSRAWIGSSSTASPRQR